MLWHTLQDGLVGPNPDSALKGKETLIHATTRVSPAGTVLGEIRQAGTDGALVPQHEASGAVTATETAGGWWRPGLGGRDGGS